MRSVEQTAKTLDEAVKISLDVLETTRENVTIRVIEETKAKLFGLFGKDSVTVKVTKKEKTAEELVSSMFKDYKTEDQLAAEAKVKREVEARAKAEKAKEVLKVAAKKAKENEDARKARELARENAKLNDLQTIEEVSSDANSVKKEIITDRASKVESSVKKVSKSRKNISRLKQKEEKTNNNRRIYIYNEEATQKAEKFLDKIIETMKLEVLVEKDIDKQDNSVTFKLHAPELGIMIGKHGKTLDSLQYLTNLIANHGLEERVRIIVDVEDYRERREETLIRLANRLAEKVKKDGKKVELEPMNPRERKIIHMALQNNNKIVTGSDGVEPKRFVVISPKAIRNNKKFN